jgi:hypothetical protein
MSLCTRNRWTAGINCSQKETVNSKELDNKLKDLMDERNKIDTMWTTNTKSTEKINNINKK